MSATTKIVAGIILTSILGILTNIVTSNIPPSWHSYLWIAYILFIIIVVALIIINIYQGKKLRVFLAHSEADKVDARHLYGRLKANHFDPWLDEEKLLPGQSWEAAIAEAVTNSDVFLVCISRSAVNSQGFLNQEIAYAFDVAQRMSAKDIFIIPVRIEDYPVPSFLRGFHWVNLFEETGYSKLTKALEERKRQLRNFRALRFRHSLSNVGSDIASAILDIASIALRFLLFALVLIGMIYIIFQLTRLERPARLSSWETRGALPIITATTRDSTPTAAPLSGTYVTSIDPTAEAMTLCSIAIVVVEEVLVRSHPDLDGEIVAYLPRDTVVEVSCDAQQVGDGLAWVFVRNTNHTRVGWIPFQDLQYTE